MLFYAFAAGHKKGARAEELLAQGGVTSVQVFNEFVNVSRKKLALDWKETNERVAVLKDLLDAPIALTEDIHDAGRKLAKEHVLAFYDALIVSAAQAAGCKLLYSEDMQDGRKFGAVAARNPFV